MRQKCHAAMGVLLVAVLGTSSTAGAANRVVAWKGFDEHRCNPVAIVYGSPFAGWRQSCTHPDSSRHGPIVHCLEGVDSDLMISTPGRGLDKTEVVVLTRHKVYTVWKPSLGSLTTFRH